MTSNEPHARHHRRRPLHHPRRRLPRLDVFRLSDGGDDARRPIADHRISAQRAGLAGRNLPAPSGCGSRRNGRSRSELPSLEEAAALDKIAARWFSWYNAAFLLGAAGGGLIFGWLGDRIGRVPRDGGQHLHVLGLFRPGLFRQHAGATVAVAGALRQRRRRHVADGRGLGLRSLVGGGSPADCRVAGHLGQRRPDDLLRHGLLLGSRPRVLAVDVARLRGSDAAGVARLVWRAGIAPLARGSQQARERRQATSRWPPSSGRRWSAAR